GPEALAHGGGRVDEGRAIAVALRGDLARRSFRYAVDRKLERRAGIGGARRGIRAAALEADVRVERRVLLARAILRDGHLRLRAEVVEIAFDGVKRIGDEIDRDRRVAE